MALAHQINSIKKRRVELSAAGIFPEPSQWQESRLRLMKHSIPAFYKYGKDVIVVNTNRQIAEAKKYAYNNGRRKLVTPKPIKRKDVKVLWQTGTRNVSGWNRQHGSRTLHLEHDKKTE